MGNKTFQEYKEGVVMAYDTITSIRTSMENLHALHQDKEIVLLVCAPYIDLAGEAQLVANKLVSDMFTEEGRSDYSLDLAAYQAEDLQKQYTLLLNLIETYTKIQKGEPL